MVRSRQLDGPSRPDRGEQFVVRPHPERHLPAVEDGVVGAADRADHVRGRPAAAARRRNPTRSGSRRTSVRAACAARFPPSGPPPASCPPGSWSERPAASGVRPRSGASRRSPRPPLPSGACAFPARRPPRAIPPSRECAGTPPRGPPVPASGPSPSRRTCRPTPATRHTATPGTHAPGHRSVTWIAGPPTSAMGHGTWLTSPRSARHARAIAIPAARLPVTAPPQSMIRAPATARDRHPRLRGMTFELIGNAIGALIQGHGDRSARSRSSSAARDCNRSRTASGEEPLSRIVNTGQPRSMTAPGCGMSAKAGTLHGSNWPTRS